MCSARRHSPANTARASPTRSLPDPRRSALGSCSRPSACAHPCYLPARRYRVAGLPSRPACVAASAPRLPAHVETAPSRAECALASRMCRARQERTKTRPTASRARRARAGSALNTRLHSKCGLSSMLRVSRARRGSTKCGERRERTETRQQQRAPAESTPHAIACQPPSAVYQTRWAQAARRGLDTARDKRRELIERLEHVWSAPHVQE